MRTFRRVMMAGILAGVSLGSCRCNEEELDDLRPSIAVDPDPIEFNLRRVNADTSLPFMIINTGTADLTVKAIRVEPAGAPFTVDLDMVTFPIILPEKQQKVLQVVFHPPTRGPFNATLVFESDDKEKPNHAVAVSGEGGPPRISVAPESINFDLVNQGMDVERTLQVSNTGLDVLRVSQVYLDAASNPGFRLAPMDNFGSGDIPVEQNALVRVEMIASITGQATGTLHILSDADGVPDKTVPVLATANLAPVVTVVERDSMMSDVQTDLYLSKTLITSAVDPEGDPFTITRWQLTRPLGSSAFLEMTGVPDNRRMYIDTVGVYRVEVTATDSRGAVGTGIANIRAIRDLALRLTWEPDPNAPCRTASTPDFQCGKTDVDMHLVAPGGMEGDYFTGCSGQMGCSATCRRTGSSGLDAGSPDAGEPPCKSQGKDTAYANRNPDWGVLGDPYDDPSLDIDDAYGYGPENISMNSPVAGDYKILVHFCNDRLTTEGAVARVEVFFHGDPAPVPVLGPVTLQGEGALWLAGVVHYDPNATPKFTMTDFNASPVFLTAASNLCTQ